MPVATRRGFREAKDLPSSVRIKFGKTEASIALFPGMSTDALNKAVILLFDKELKVYGKDPYEIVGVTFKNEEDNDELVPLDVLARAPAVVGDKDKVVLLKVHPEHKPPPPPPGLWRTALLYAIYLLILLLVRTVVVRPFLRRVYRTGPSFRLGMTTVGFWEGAKLSNICASITGAQDAHFWESNRSQCVAIFAQKEEGFIIAVEAISFVLFLYTYRAEIRKVIGGLQASTNKAAMSVVDSQLKKLRTQVVDKAEKKIAEAGTAASKSLNDSLGKYSLYVNIAVVVVLALLFAVYGPVYQFAAV